MKVYVWFQTLSSASFSHKISIPEYKFKHCCCSVPQSVSNFLGSHGPWSAALQASLSFTMSWGACSNSCPFGQWCLPTISSSVTPFTFYSQSFPASESFPMSRLFASRGQTMEDLASALVLPMNFQDWFPLGLTGLNSTVQGTLKSLLQHPILRHQFSGSPSSLWFNSHICTSLLEKPQLWLDGSLLAKWCLNMLSRFVIAFLPRSLFSINFMVAVTVYSDFGALENKVCHYFQIQK